MPLFEHLTIGSRPASRRASDVIDFENLRAIPFVATWSILKVQIPGFYGLGTALQQMLDAGREGDLRRLYRSSRFFRALLDNAAMSLLKSRFDITGHLEGDAKVGPLWRRIRDEARTVERGILRLAEQPKLLANDPVNRASIAFREDMLLPLLVIVHDAFARFNSLARQGRSDCDAAVVARQMALKGMAAVINATRNAAYRPANRDGGIANDRTSHLHHEVLVGLPGVCEQGDAEAAHAAGSRPDHLLADRLHRGGLERQLTREVDIRTFFAEAPAIHPNTALITGVVCGVRVENVEDPLMRKVRCLDKLIDELAKGKAMEKILRR